MTEEALLKEAFTNVSGRTVLMYTVSEIVPRLPKQQVDYIVTLYFNRQISKNLAIKELVAYH